MEHLTNSRLITWPSTVEKSSNHTVVLVDATSQEIEDIASFCRSSGKNFDIYLYEGSSGDLEYLNYITNLSEAVLINDSSQVKVTPSETRYGSNKELKTPLAYFEQIEFDKIK